MAETLLTAHRETRDDALVLSFQGEVDVLTAPIMRTELDAAVAEGPTVLLVDLTGLRFLGSVGIAELIRAHRQTSQNGIRLRLATPPFIRRLLDLTGVATVLDILDTDDDVPA